MKNKLKKITAVLTVVGLMVAGPLAYAEYGGDDSQGGKGHKKGGDKFFKELGLTEEQREQLKGLREGKQDGKAVHEEIKSKMEAIHAVIAQPETAWADVSGLVGEVNTLKGQMFSRRIQGVFAMKEVLTPEQFAKMQEHRKKNMKNKHEGQRKHQKGSQGDSSEVEEE